jgi:hypothetical protein
MPNTFTLIASSTAGAGGTTAFDFTSIPSTYTDLLLKWSARQDLGTVAASDFIYINGSQTSYSGRWLFGDGASAGSYAYTGNFTFADYGGDGASATANTFANAEIYIPNYAGSTNKSMLSHTAMENNATTAYQALGANLWSNTAAINRVTISTSATNVTGGAQKFVQYSTAYLYGIVKS